MSRFEADYVKFRYELMRAENHTNFLILAHPRFHGEIGKDESLSRYFVLTQREDGSRQNRLFDHNIFFSTDISHHSHYEFVNCGYDNNIEKALQPYVEKERKRIDGEFT